MAKFSPFLFTLRSFAIGGKTSVYWSRKDMHYVATNDCYVRHFRAKRQAISTYSSGFINRARSLSNAYCLNNISFKKNDVVVDCGANVGDLELYFRISHQELFIMQ